MTYIDPNQHRVPNLSVDELCIQLAAISGLFTNNINDHTDTLDGHELTIDAHTETIPTKLTRTPEATFGVRTLDVAFTVSDTDPALCFYPVTFSLGAVGALSKAYVTPTVGTTVYQAVGYEQLLSILVSPPSYAAVIPLWVPAGDTVTLASTTQNSGAVTLGTPVELIFA